MRQFLSSCGIGPFTLRNPIVYLPFFTSYADENGFVTPTLLQHYKRMSASGVGMVVVEAALIRNCASPYSISAYAPEHLPGLKALSQVIHEQGANAILQICHPGRFGRSSENMAPSAVAPFDVPELTPRAMTEEDMRGVAADFAEAAAIAREAGFDGVELHGATGYLLASFVSPHTNRRTDDFGGGVERRVRFPLMVCEYVRKTVGEDFPVGYRFMSREYIDGGLSLDDGVEAAALLAAALDPAYISVTAGTYECFALLAQASQKPQEGYMLEEARAVKEAVGDVPIIAAGHLQSLSICEKALSSGYADAVGLGRPLFADPDWLRKISGQMQAEVRACIQCNFCQKQAEKNSPVFCSRWSKKEKEERFQAMPRERLAKRGDAGHASQ